MYYSSFVLRRHTDCRTCLPRGAGKCGQPPIPQNQFAAHAGSGAGSRSRHQVNSPPPSSSSAQVGRRPPALSAPSLFVQTLLLLRRICLACSPSPKSRNSPSLCSSGRVGGGRDGRGGGRRRRAVPVVVPQPGGDRARVPVAAGRPRRGQGGRAPGNLLLLHPRRLLQAPTVSAPPLTRDGVRVHAGMGVRYARPQVTLATAILLCHRFYLRQSLARNEWQTIATVCVFLASKIEEMLCQLRHVVTVAYETMYRKKPDAAKRIHQDEVLEKQKSLILVGETLLLSTIRFDFNIQHPYEPLKLALKNLGITQKEVKQAAVNFINDTLPTTLALQFKPHYIAAGSLFLAAKLHNIMLFETGKIWSQEFEVNPKQLQANDRFI